MMIFLLSLSLSLKLFIHYFDFCLSKTPFTCPNNKHQLKKPRPNNWELWSLNKLLLFLGQKDLAFL